MPVSTIAPRQGFVLFLKKRPYLSSRERLLSSDTIVAPAAYFGHFCSRRSIAGQKKNRVAF